jgi:hypothetical protein
MGLQRIDQAGELTPHGAPVTPRPNPAMAGNEVVGGGV